MRLLDLTLERPAENLALDEALLDAAEAGELEEDEVLRLWEPTQPFVVVGRSSRAAEEVDLETCRRHAIPVLRRCSGGTAVVAGPGCLMYGVVLSYAQHPELRVLDAAHKFVLARVAAALAPQLPAVAPQGISDVAVGERKISGNSVRCKRTHLLYHGTLLYRFPLPLIGLCLRTAPRQPEYRRGRSHEDFVANVDVDIAEFRQAFLRQWAVSGILTTWPGDRVRRLVAERYDLPEWNFRL